MREPYIPLFTSTVRSSLWSLTGDCLKVFLTMALESDPEGYVSASADGIRRLVDLPLVEVQKHLTALEAPDPESKDITREAGRDGRRIERVPNGWRVVNIEWYREQARKQAELFRKRKWWDEKGSAARRAARPTETETETETERDLKKSPLKGPPLVDRGSRFSESWEPARSKATIALESKVRDVPATLEAFKDWARGTTRRYRDWDATYRSALRREIAKPTPTPKPRMKTAAEALANFK